MYPSNVCTGPTFVLDRRLSQSSTAVPPTFVLSNLCNVRPLIQRPTFVLGPNEQFKITNSLISNSYLIKKALKETVLNQELPSLYGRLLEITLTVPLSLVIMKKREGVQPAMR